ncbi:putative pheophorbide a oxygenase [Helianthus annuus]|nr:putative pheophorbide a oxygenase [Helianthus annuus]
MFKPISSLSFSHKKSKSLLLNQTQFPKSKFTKFNAISPSDSTQPAAQPEKETETGSFDQDYKFDWFSHWYPLMPVCDLDKRAPCGKKVLGLDVVVWWDKNENEWKVFGDRCPHRLAPLSEGRIDQWGRLQCVYHGWCFGGSGDCKFIPQAPLDGPAVHSFEKACVAVYPSTVQNDIVWFWPNTDSRYKDILTEKKPPYFPELDDPSFSFQIFNRDIPYGFLDREGGSPIDMKIQKIDKNGFTTTQQPGIEWNFISPCLLQRTITIKEGPENTQKHKPPRKDLLILLCTPVSPGKSRLISVIPTKFWTDDLFLPRWKNHMIQNLIIDSDLYLLFDQERKLMELGPSNWQNVSFVPTKADANVVAYRKWLKKYSGGQMDWGTKFNGYLPPTLPREQLMDRLQINKYIILLLCIWKIRVTYIVSPCGLHKITYLGTNSLKSSSRVLTFHSITFGGINF